MKSSQLLICIISLLVVTTAKSEEVVEDRSIHWDFDGTLSGAVVEQEVTFSEPRRSMFNLKCNCDSLNENDFVQFNLYETSTYKSIISVNQKCVVDELVYFSHPHIFDKAYKLEIYGNSGATYTTELVLNATDIDIQDQKGSSTFLVPKGEMVVKSFDITDKEIISSADWSYIQVTAVSPDKFIDRGKTTSESDRYVGKMMLTQNPEDLAIFFDNPDADIAGCIRLSFSTFGVLTISNASKPILASGTWIVGVMIPPKYKKDVTYQKEVTVTVNIVTDYSYAPGIGILLLVSLLGIIVPIISRVFFDAGNMEFTKFKMEYWCITVKSWFWSGQKGLTYLTALLASLLIVSAYQVAHAKYREMMTSGNRDTCFYNEKCYRPYGAYYDISVNGISSNLPFMVQGVIMLLYYSFAEAYCRSNGHEHFDYSIPYSFGLAFICEGFGSLTYHICPSQIIFQFDTLFMFVISIISIIAIHEGYSIRNNDVKYSTIAKHKAIRTPKVFAFFVGPVYFFNFIGNLITTEYGDSSQSIVTIMKTKVSWQGLPIPFIIVFYVLFLIWWILILAWIAYKLDLLPDSLNPQNIGLLDEIVEVDGNDFASQPQVSVVLQHSLAIRVTLFGFYCIVVLVSFVMTFLGKLPFSIFILGMLIIAQISLTLIFFFPLIWVVLKFFYKLPVKVMSTKFLLSQHIFVTCGMFIYVLLACGVTGLALVFFTTFAVTDKSVAPWKSRELNGECFLNDFYDTHDFWHLFASFGLMLVTMLSVQISKPCRDCYLRYCSHRDSKIRRMTRLYKRQQTLDTDIPTPAEALNGAPGEALNGAPDKCIEIDGAQQEIEGIGQVEIVVQSDDMTTQESTGAGRNGQSAGISRPGFENPSYEQNKNQKNNQITNVAVNV